MKTKVTMNKPKCRFCHREMNVSGRGYLANPFCNECQDERLEESGAIDLRDNHIINDLGNGYVEIIPLDPKKKWKKSK